MLVLQMAYPDCLSCYEFGTSDIAGNIFRLRVRPDDHGQRPFISGQRLLPCQLIIQHRGIRFRNISPLSSALLNAAAQCCLGKREIEDSQWNR